MEEKKRILDCFVFFRSYLVVQGSGLLFGPWLDWPLWVIIFPTWLSLGVLLLFGLFLLIVSLYDCVRRHLEP